MHLSLCRQRVYHQYQANTSLLKGGLAAKFAAMTVLGHPDYVSVGGVLL